MSSDKIVILGNHFSNKYIKLGVGDGVKPTWERDQLSDLKRDLDPRSVGINIEADAETIEDLQRGYNAFINACKILSWVPSPVGNPFSMALVGHNIAEKEYGEAALNFIGAIPWAAILGRIPGFIRLTLSKVPPTLLRAVWLLVRPYLLWLLRSTINICNKISNVFNVIEAAEMLAKVFSIDNYRSSVLTFLGEEVKSTAEALPLLIKKLLETFKKNQVADCQVLIAEVLSKSF